MDGIIEVISRISDFVWGLPLIILLVGTGLWLTIMLKGLQFTKLWHALGKVRFGHQYEFIPYWSQTVTQPLDEKEAVATFYVDRAAKRALMFIMNFDGVPRDKKAIRRTLTMDFSKIGIDAASVKATNLVHGEPVSLKENSLTIAFPSHTYRMIAFEEKK